MVMRSHVFLIMLMALCALAAEPVQSTGMGESAPCAVRTPLERYCVNHGGCPQNGFCYFPDGGYCDLGSFYNGTCPGRGYYEEAMWWSEAYRFLHSEDYYPSSTQYGGYYPPNWYFNSYNSPWPVYRPGMGPNWL